MTDFAKIAGTADVLVVGGGGSGLAAAIEAATLGRSVILLEKNPKLGGSTIRSIGSFSATGTPHQIRKQILDCPEDHFEDLGKFNSQALARSGDRVAVDNLKLRRILVDNANDTMRWLMEMGVCFFGPTAEPPHRRARMHNVLPNSAAFGYHLARRARAMGVKIHTRRCATRLLTESGVVVGVECTNEAGVAESYRARGGVVLACGDFSASVDMKLRFSSPEVAQIGPCCNPANTGDGHRMAMELGGRVLNGHMAMALMRFVPPPRRLWLDALPPWPILAAFMSWSLENMPDWLLRPFIMSFLTTVLAVSPRLFEEGAILVNRDGQRFANEQQNPVFALAQQPGQIAYAVFDSRVARMFSQFPNYISTAPGIAYAYLNDYRRSRSDIFCSASSLPELARKLKMPEYELVQSVSQSRSRSSVFDRARGNAASLPVASDMAPFHALGPIGAYVKGTDGGLAINERCEVLNEQDEPISGLFAAGLAGQGGVLLEGHGHHLAWAFVSGRLAGRGAAYRATAPLVDAVVKS